MYTWKVKQQQAEEETCVFRTKYDDVISGRRWNTGGNSKRGCEEFSVTDSIFADDTAALYPNRKTIEASAPQLFAHIKLFGMEAHCKKPNSDKESKSVVLFVSAPASTYHNPETFDEGDYEHRDDAEHFSLGDIDVGDGCTISVVKEGKYLGSMMARDGTDEQDLNRRIKSARQAFGSLKKCVFRSRDIVLEAKKMVYLSMVLSIVLYGSESWSVSAEMMRKLESFHRMCIRSMCRINMWHVREHKISTGTLLKRTGILPIGKYLARRQLSWVGKVMRMPQCRLPRKMVACWVYNQRPDGRPMLTYGESVVRSLKIAGIGIENWGELAADKAAWCAAADIQQGRKGRNSGLNAEAAAFTPAATARDAAATRRYRGAGGVMVSYQVFCQQQEQERQQERRLRQQQGLCTCTWSEYCAPCLQQQQQQQQQHQQQPQPQVNRLTMVLRGRYGQTPQ